MLVILKKSGEVLNLESDVKGLRSDVITVVKEVTVLVTTLTEALGVAKKIDEKIGKNEEDLKAPNMGGQNKYVA